MELRPNPNEDALLFSDLFQVDFPIPSPRLADLADFPPSLQESETAVYNRVLTRTKTVEFNLKVDEMLPRSKSAAFPGEFMDIETWDVSDDFVDPFERSDSIIDSISQNISRESSSPDMRRSDSGKRLLEREPSLSSLEDLWQKTFETGFQDDSSEGSKRARGSTGGEGKAGVSEGKKINPKKLPAARFCHICLRKDSAVKMARCANLTQGTCRKVICEVCFGKSGWDFSSASNPSSGWLCTHCRQNCPPNARCVIYKKVNERRERSRSRSRSRDPRTNSCGNSRVNSRRVLPVSEYQPPNPSRSVTNTTNNRTFNPNQHSNQKRNVPSPMSDVTTNHPPQSQPERTSFPLTFGAFLADEIDSTFLSKLDC